MYQESFKGQNKIIYSLLTWSTLPNLEKGLIVCNIYHIYQERIQYTYHTYDKKMSQHQQWVTSPFQLKMAAAAVDCCHDNCLIRKLERCTHYKKLFNYANSIPDEFAGLLTLPKLVSVQITKISITT